MIGFNHALAGIGIALAAKHPIVIAPLALLSHFLLDMLPHFHHQAYGDTLKRPYSLIFRRVILIDTCTTLFFTFAAVFLWPQLWLAIGIGVIFAMLPDYIWPLYGKSKLLEKFFHFHLKIQWWERPSGLAVELPFSILLLSALLIAL